MDLANVIFPINKFNYDPFNYVSRHCFYNLEKPSVSNMFNPNERLLLQLSLQVTKAILSHHFQRLHHK